MTLLASSTYEKEQLDLLDLKRIPSHVAIVMDGNRRWARARSLPFLVGHWRGAETVSKIVRASQELGIKTLTIYAFSTENWKRSPFEIQALMRLQRSYLKQKQRMMVEEGVRLSAIGDLARLPSDLRAVLEETMEMTAPGKCIELVLAISYGGRDEIKRAIQAMIEDHASGKLPLSALSEECISRYLDTAGRRDPDLLIRTSGESRLSNFLLWQSSYTEIVISPVLWPDFGPQDLLQAVVEYQKRNIRQGT